MKIFILFIFIFLLSFACTRINRNEQEYYKDQKAIRHGIVPIRSEVASNSITQKMNQSSEKLGEQIFKRDCIRCHGVTGEGNGPDAQYQRNKPANLKETVNSVKHFDFYMTISQMDGSMPGWFHPYTDEERRQITAYLKTLKSE